MYIHEPYSNNNNDNDNNMYSIYFLFSRRRPGWGGGQDGGARYYIRLAYYARRRAFRPVFFRFRNHPFSVKRARFPHYFPRARHHCVYCAFATIFHGRAAIDAPHSAGRPKGPSE